MDQMKRYAIYYAPPSGDFATAAAQWLGWDLQRGVAVRQPVLDLPRPLEEVTMEPRRYGFHGTLKAPFRLAEGQSFADLQAGVQALATACKVVEMPGLHLKALHGFLALIPLGDADKLRDLAAQVVFGLEQFRSPLTAAEIQRRRPETLSKRQQELLAEFGYPFVLEEFQFHLTLSGRLDAPERALVESAARTYFAGLLPRPFRIEDLCLCGEDEAGRFHMLHRARLSA